jgi:L-alanine-DL-glutamate epimerase-like enolase superfamily enzyme
MKITAIETIVIRMPYTCGGPMPALADKVWSTADTLLVKISTDTGITGWGEAFGYNIIPATKAAIDEVIGPLYIGRDPTMIEALMLEMQQKLHIFGRSGPAIFALSGIDIALWDIAGKRAGQPVYQLLGGSAKSSLTCYASLMRYTDPNLVAANTARAVGQGYRFVKLHEIDVPQTRAAREAAGDDVHLMLDTNCPWSLREALDMAERLQPFGLYWLEEPCWPPENYAALAEVRAAGGIAISAGENATTVMQFQHMFEAGAVDFAQPSPTKCGGITELRKIYTLAGAHNVKMAPHTPYFGPGFLAGLHVNAAHPHDTLVEWLYFDLEATLYGDAILPRRGQVAVPQGAGLGYDPDPQVIAKYRSA